MIYSTVSAFAALMQDGSVVTWRDVSTGGDSSRVQAELMQHGGVDTIYSTSGAFAAKMQDGSVVTVSFSPGRFAASMSHLPRPLRFQRLAHGPVT